MKFILHRDPSNKLQKIPLLAMQLSDNVNAHEMRPDGTYAKVKRKEGQPRIDSQLGMYAMLEHAWPDMPQAGRPAGKRPAKPRARKAVRRARQEGSKKAGLLGTLSALWRR